MAVMAMIVTDSVTGQQTPHQCRDGHFSGFEQQVKMVGDQSPGVAAGRRLRQKSRQATNKAITVTVIFKNCAALNSPADNVMKRTGSVYAGLSWHEGSVA